MNSAVVAVTGAGGEISRAARTAFGALAGPRVSTRLWAFASAAAGAVMLARPQAVARLASGTGSAPDAAVVSILGGRQLLQGTALLIRPTPLLVIGGLAVDALHAASMVAAAVIWPDYRRAALTSAAVASSSAVTGALILRSSRARRQFGPTIRRVPTS